MSAGEQLFIKPLLDQHKRLYQKLPTSQSVKDADKRQFFLTNRNFLN